MTDFDAIVIGAGHNGLTAAALLQKAGLRTLCLDSKLYAGGMASTVELFDGYKFEIAGSVQIPTSADGQPRARPRHAADRRPRRDVGVAARRRRRTAHLLHRSDEAADAHQRGARRRGRQRHGRADGVVPGTDAGAGAIRRGPAAEDTRRDVRLRDKRIRAFDDHRPACSARSPTCSTATCPTRRSTVRCEACCRSSRSTPPIAGPPPRAPRRRWPTDSPSPTRTRCWSRSCSGGIGALTSHLQRTVHVQRRRAAAAQQGRRDPGRRRARHRGSPRGRLDDHRADRRLRRRARPHGQRHARRRTRCPPTIRERFSRVDHRGSYLQMHFALDGIPEFAAPYEVLNDPAMQSNIGIFSTPEELQQQWEDCRRGIVPADPAIALQIPSVNDPAWRRRVSTPPRRSRCGSRSRRRSPATAR